MKKYILLTTLIITVITINNSFAQTSVDIGIKAGLSVPDLSGNSSVNPINGEYSYNPGSDAAISAAFNFSKHFAIQPQLQYSLQGYMQNGVQGFAVGSSLQPQFINASAPAKVLYGSYYSLTQVNYLMVPILAKYTFSIGNRWDGFVAAGPSFNKALSAKYITTGSSKIYTDPQQTQPYTTVPVSFYATSNISSNVKAVNTTFAEYAGIDYRLANNNKILIEAGENFGAATIQNNGTSGKLRTGAATINFGYEFSVFKGKIKKTEQVSDLEE